MFLHVASQLTLDLAQHFITSLFVWTHVAIYTYVCMQGYITGIMILITTVISYNVAN